MKRVLPLEKISTTWRGMDEQVEKCKNIICSCYFKLSTSLIVNKPFLPRIHSAAITAPRANPFLLFALCVSVSSSIFDEKETSWVPGTFSIRLEIMGNLSKLILEVDSFNSHLFKDLSSCKIYLVYFAFQSI